MTKATLRILAGVERRLNTLIRLESTACGCEKAIARCDRQRERLMKFIEVELENALREVVQ